MIGKNPFIVSIANDYAALNLDHSKTLISIVSAFKVNNAPFPAALALGLPVPLLLGLSVANVRIIK